MRLSLAFGRWDVDNFLSELDPRQFDEWQALNAIEGIGAHRDDLRARHLVASMLQSQGADVTAADLEFLPHERAERDAADECDDEDIDYLRPAFGG